MSNKKILIVGDDADVRMGLHVRLKANNYDVFFAVDGFSSLSEARKHEPDLILLDLGLPAGEFPGDGQDQSCAGAGDDSYNRGFRALRSRKPGTCAQSGG